MSKKSSGLLWLFLGLFALAVIIGGSTYYTIAKLPTALDAASSGGRVGMFGSTGSGELTVVHVEGVIDDKKASEVIEFLDDIAEDDAVKALVVRVNSPGGTVGASQEILAALKRFGARGVAEKKRPIVCSMGDVAASGGVYLAMGCDYIFANAGTLTGSIGVIMQMMNLKDLYGWAKMEPVIIKAGKFKDAGSETRRLTDEERALFQNLLNETHAQFKQAVLVGRPKLLPEELDKFADGRVISGQQAKSLGLVDAIGGEWEALRYAADRAGLGAKPKIFHERFKKTRLQSFFESESHAPADSPQALLEGLARVMQGSAALAPRIQAGVPYYLAEFAVH
jgi:protease-4